MSWCLQRKIIGVGGCLDTSKISETIEMRSFGFSHNQIEHYYTKSKQKNSPDIYTSYLNKLTINMTYEMLTNRLICVAVFFLLKTPFLDLYGVYIGAYRHRFWSSPGHLALWRLIGSHGGNRSGVGWGKYMPRKERQGWVRNRNRVG